MLAQDYTVRLDNFEGPLDLLLFLIRRAELDITEISIASITDQYLAYLDRIHEIDVELAGEFLVLAATLLEIKSRYVVPAEEGDAKTADSAEEVRDADDEPAPNPAADLIRQLLAYKAYRDAADTLDRKRESWERRYPAGKAAAEKIALREAVGDPADVELEEVELYDLVEAFRRIMETVVFERIGDHTVTYDDTPIELHAEDIIDRLKRESATSPQGRMSLQRIFEGRNKSEMIGLFLALLELTRQRVIRVLQEKQNDEIVMELAPDEHRPSFEADLDSETVEDEEG